MEAVFDRIQTACGCAVPETAEQRAWVERFAALGALPKPADGLVAFPSPLGQSKNNVRVKTGK